METYGDAQLDEVSVRDIDELRAGDTHRLNRRSICAQLEMANQAYHLIR